jgi:hypothetical protein
MKLTKEEKDEFMSKYTEDETSPEVLNYLKRHFQTYKIDILTLNEPEVMISIDGKSYFVRSNKKRLVNKLFYTIQDSFSNIDEKIVRRTIKKFIDGISI